MEKIQHCLESHPCISLLKRGGNVQLAHLYLGLMITKSCNSLSRASAISHHIFILPFAPFNLTLNEDLDFHRHTPSFLPFVFAYPWQPCSLSFAPSKFCSVLF